MSENQKRPEDYSMLPSGFIYETGPKTWIYGFLPIIVFMIFYTVSFVVLPENFQLQAKIIGFSQFLIILFVLFAAFWKYIRNWLYKSARNEFVRKNNLVLLPEDEFYSQLSPSVDESGAHSQKVTGYNFTVDGKPVSLYDYSFATGSGKHRRDYKYAIANFTLTKPYPHLFLDGKANGRNYKYTGSQRIELEGDFNNYFQVYIPEGSQIGALAVFSPDVMQTLIQTGHAYDIEINNKSVSIITPGYAYTRENLSRLLSASGALLKELEELDRTWQPEYQADGRPFVLKRRNTLLISILVFISYFVFRVVLEIYANR